MGRPYSNDLRERVVGAVEQGGMSRHQAAAHFGVAISTAINWFKNVFVRRPVSHRGRWAVTSLTRYPAGGV